MKQPSFFLSPRFNSGLRVENKDFFRHFEGADQTTGRYSWGSCKDIEPDIHFFNFFLQAQYFASDMVFALSPFLGGPSGLCFLKNVVAFYP